MAAAESISGYGLGIDAGGTGTRWALADAQGVVHAEGAVDGVTALMLATADGRVALAQSIATLAAEVRASLLAPVAAAEVRASLLAPVAAAEVRASLLAPVAAAEVRASLPAPAVTAEVRTSGARPERILGGFTGLGEDGGALLRAMLAEAFDISTDRVDLASDIEIAYRDLYAPGEGYLVYAGTGSIAAFIDADGVFQRAGGRGSLLDDGGGGYWIAREALRHVWRTEDERPGAWQESPMARALLDAVGGPHWDHSRQFVYGRTRGEIGRLALHVAATAESDAVALAILQEAGRELARLANALVARYGPRPVALGGRAVSLHPAIAQSFHAALRDGITAQVRVVAAHVAAARIAARKVHTGERP